MSYPLFYYQQACSSAKTMQKINLATGAVDSEVFELMGRSLCLEARCARPFSRGISIEVDKRAPENQNTHTHTTHKKQFLHNIQETKVSVHMVERKHVFFSQEQQVIRTGPHDLVGLKWQAFSNWDLAHWGLGQVGQKPQRRDSMQYATCLMKSLSDWVGWLDGLKWLNIPGVVCALNTKPRLQTSLGDSARFKSGVQSQAMKPSHGSSRLK